MNLTPHALNWYERGITPIPLLYQSKKPLVKWGRFRERRPSEIMVRAWFAHNLRNMGLLLDHTRITVLDFDVPAQYFKWNRRTDFNTFTVQSRRGWHSYFIVKEEKPAIASYSPHCDVKTHGLITASPSKHVSGVRYKIVNDVGIQTVDTFADLGVELVDRTWSPTESFPSFGTPLGDGVVAKIKSGVPILSYLQLLKPTPILRGEEYVKICCPFHDDNSPSMQVWPEHGRCTCWASHCRANIGRWIDVIDVCSLWWGLNNTEAIASLAREI